MANVVKNMTITAGSTAGVFATLGATIAAANIQILVPSGASVGIVNDNTGAAPIFPIQAAPFTVGASEVWIKNYGSSSATLVVRLFDVA